MFRCKLLLSISILVLAFVGPVQAVDFTVVNSDFEGGWMIQTMGWGGDPAHEVPVGWGTWTALPNLEDMYPIAGNPGGATPTGGAALEVLAGNAAGGYSFLWTLAAPTFPVGTTSLTMYADVIDLTPGGAGGDYAGLSIADVETKLTGVTDVWQTFSYTVAVSGITSAELKIVNSTDQVAVPGDTPCVYGFDNVVLTPEPATIALLGLGGLALLRRRR